MFGQTSKAVICFNDDSETVSICSPNASLRLLISKQDHESKARDHLNHAVIMQLVADIQKLTSRCERLEAELGNIKHNFAALQHDAMDGGRGRRGRTTSSLSLNLSGYASSESSDEGTCLTPSL